MPKWVVPCLYRCSHPSEKLIFLKFFMSGMQIERRQNTVSIAVLAKWYII